MAIAHLFSSLKGGCHGERTGSARFHGQSFYPRRDNFSGRGAMRHDRDLLHHSLDTHLPKVAETSGPGINEIILRVLAQVLPVLEGNH